MLTKPIMTFEMQKTSSKTNGTYLNLYIFEPTMTKPLYNAYKKKIVLLRFIIR